MGKREDSPGQSQGLARGYQVAAQMVATILMCLAGGWWLEQRWPRLSPWAMLGGALLGMASAIYHAIKETSAGKDE